MRQALASYPLHNQLYNSVVTAHAILMSAPLRLVLRVAPKELLNLSNQVKSLQAGRAKLYGETRTAKLKKKGENVISIEIIG